MRFGQRTGRPSNFSRSACWRYEGLCGDRLLDFGIKHEADIAYGFDNALRGVLAVLLVVVENDNGRKNDQRQRGSRNQKS